MARLDIEAAVRETLAEARDGLALYLPIAAAFALLPNLLAAMFGPPLPRTPAELTPIIVLVHLALPAMAGAVGQLAISRLLLDRARPTVGWALRHALLLLPVVLLAIILSGVAVTAGLLAAIVPGLYFAGRLALVLPVVAAEGGSAVGAVMRSWALTDEQGWRMFLFQLLWLAGFALLSVIGGVVGGAAGALLTASGAKALGGFVVILSGATVGGVISVYNAVGVAVVYRRLTTRV